MEVFRDGMWLHNAGSLDPQCIDIDIGIGADSPLLQNRQFLSLD